MDNAQFLPLLISLVRQAGEKILEVYRQQNIAVEYKLDNSPVTKADQVAHHLIVDTLSRQFSYPVISEESEDNTLVESTAFCAFKLY